MIGEKISYSPERPQLVDVTARTHKIFGKREGLPNGITSLHRVGTFMLSDEKGHATMGFSGYHKENVHPGKKDTRPLIVVCNGGPIAASALSELSATAPWILEHEGENPVNILSGKRKFNYDSPFAHADLVYFDPVGTGVGRVLTGDPKRYLGMQQDIASFDAALDLYRKEYGYESNPIILVGASFADFRMTGLALKLQERNRPISAMSIICGHYDYALEVNRPSAGNYQEGIGDPKDPRPFAAALPVMALTAQFHGRLSPEEQRMTPGMLYKKVWDFASQVYLKDNPDNLSREEIIQKLMHYTSLSREFISEDLLISTDVFREEFLEGQTLSMLDSRLSVPKTDNVVIDTVLDKWIPEYEEAATEELRRTGFPEEDMPADGYRLIVNAYPDWDFSGIWSKRRVHEAMRQLLKGQPDLPITHISGIYDIQIPPARAELFWQEVASGIPEKVSDINYADVQHKYYPLDSVQQFLLPSGHIPGVTDSAILNKILSGQVAYVTSKEEEKRGIDFSKERRRNYNNIFQLSSEEYDTVTRF